jgi:hypothetical protein
MMTHPRFEEGRHQPLNYNAFRRSWLLAKARSAHSVGRRVFQDAAASAFANCGHTVAYVRSNYVPCADVLEPTSSITGSGSHEPSGMNLCGYLVVFRVIYFPTSCSANTVLRISFTDILAVSVAAAS